MVLAFHFPLPPRPGADMATSQIAQGPPSRSSFTRGRQTRLLTAHLLAEAGDGITAVALPLLVLAGTGSVTDTALVFIVSALPTLLFGLHAGVVADRFDRKRL